MLYVLKQLAISPMLFDPQTSYMVLKTTSNTNTMYSVSKSHVKRLTINTKIQLIHHTVNHVYLESRQYSRQEVNLGFPIYQIEKEIKHWNDFIYTIVQGDSKDIDIPNSCVSISSMALSSF